MSHHYALSTILAFAASVLAQDTTTTSLIPLASKHFDWTNLPYQADTDSGVRGTQFGYNRCNSTTEGQSSLCQTAHINSIADFCIWAPPTGPTTIGDTEAIEVAWCTRPGYGTRVVPAGALTGVQFMRTPAYIQVVGFLNQNYVNIFPNDTGGELDPHGADFRGNPLGGLVYTNDWSGDNSTYTQVIEWHNFIGGGSFCFKACDPSNADAAHFCEHIFDRIGCAYNAPNNAQNGVFESCDGDNQAFPGVYTDSAGAVHTYSQPPESLGPITSIPYTPTVPASSNCVTYTSSVLFASAASVLPSGVSISGSSSRSSTSGTRTSTNSNPSSTGGASGGAASLAVTSLFSLLGVAAAVVFFS